MNFIDFEDDPANWDLFCAAAPNASPFNTRLWHEYMRSYSPNIEQDLSFAVVDESDCPIAIVSLFVETCGDAKQFSYAGGFLRAPVINSTLGINLKRKLEVAIFSRIDSIAKEGKISKCLFLIDPLTQRASNETYNWLMRYSFLDNTINTQIIDLSCTLDQLHASLRKSYTSLINNGEKHYEICYVDFKNASLELHESYRKLHHKAAGRVTRPRSTFDLQFEQLKRNEALLIGIKYQGVWIGFSYFNHLNGLAYYSSSADDPEAENLPAPISHCMLWNAIKYYSAHKFALFELGWQQFGDQLYDFPSTKEIEIAKFKRGMGGQTFSLYRGKKYYDYETLRKEMKENSTRLEMSYQSISPITEGTGIK